MIQSSWVTPECPRRWTIRSGCVLGFDPRLAHSETGMNPHGGWFLSTTFEVSMWIRWRMVKTCLHLAALGLPLVFAINYNCGITPSDDAFCKNELGYQQYYQYVRLFDFAQNVTFCAAFIGKA